jgi:hypothetical protein
MRKLGSIGLAAVALLIWAVPAVAAAQSASSAAVTPQAPSRSTVTEIRGEAALRRIIGSIDEIEIKNGEAVVRYRSEKGTPAKPIRVDYHEAMQGATGFSPPRVSDTDLSEFLFLMALGSYLFRQLRKRHAPLPLAVQGRRPLDIEGKR